MAPDPQQIRTVKVRQGDRGLTAAVALVAVFVLVAVLKPWDVLGLAEPGPESRPGPVAPDRATPRAAPGALPGQIAAISTQCYYTSGWRVYSLTPVGSRSVRSWSAVQPIRARGPQDERIEMTRIVADGLPVLGYCAPVTGRESPPASVTTTAWQLLDDGSLRELDLVPIERANPTGRPTQALYRPPLPGGPGEAAAWQPGRYVFRISDGPAGRYERWFGVEIVPPSVIAGAHPSPRPSPSASPSPTPRGG
jgi:hypothetical protein